MLKALNLTKMYRQKKISFYFPCRNEGSHLKEEVARLPSFVDETIIVSNKSTDNTVAVSENLGLKTIVDDRTKNNIGYGFAHMTGMAASTGDIIISADADGTYPIHNLDKILDFMLDGNFDFVLCTRYPLKEKDKVGWILQAGVRFLNLEVRLLYLLKISDILSGMWLIKKEAKNRLKLGAGDWNFSPEIKIAAASNKEIRFGEYHINVNSRKGRTKQQYFKTGFNHLLWIAMKRFNLIKND